MKQCVLLVFCVSISFSLSAMEPPASIQICTPEWQYYTQKDGGGLYNELWDAVFTPMGIRVDRHYAPFKRCRHEVRRRVRFDTFAAGYPEPGVVVPNWHLGVDLLTVVSRKEEAEAWTGTASLSHRRVSWERGFDLDKTDIIDVEVELQEFDKLRSALRMLVSDRIDYILDYEKAVRDEVAELGISEQVTIRYNAVMGPKFFMIFADTEKGRHLASVWDRRMQQLNESGALHALYKKYRDPDY
jgi:hypothetical protein